MEEVLASMSSAELTEWRAMFEVWNEEAEADRKEAERKAKARR